MSDTPIPTFTACVFAPDDIVEVRRLPSRRSTWHRASELADTTATLKRDNEAGNHIYFGANPRGHDGGTSSDDVSVARCLFADFDGVTVDEVRSRIESAGLPAPTLTLNSGHGVHTYWRLTEPMTDLAAWTGFQKDLIAVVGSDPAIHDPARIMRLPGFVNHKEPLADSYIVDADPSRAYELADLRERIPPRKQNAEKARAVEPASVTSSVVDVIARAAAFARKWPPVSEGGDGTTGRNSAAYYHAAQLTHDFGLTDAEAWPILSAWNRANDPPLDDSELRECFTKGRKYGDHAVGCKADCPPPQSKGGAPPTDCIPEDPGPPWLTIPEIGKLPAYRDGFKAISSGYAALDGVLKGGFRAGFVHILGGRTGSSKSTLVTNIVRRVALDGHPTLLFKLEEHVAEAVMRLHAAAAQVPLTALLDADTASYRDELVDGWNLIRTLPLRISDARDIGAIQRISRKHVAEGGKFIAIDQLSMIDVPDAEIGYPRATLASGALRRLARDLNVPVLLVCQINRGASKGKERLSANDLRDSGALENDAATVLLVDRVRKPDHEWSGAEPSRYLEVLVTKARYGPTTAPGKPVELLWFPRVCRVEDVAPVGVEAGHAN